MSFIMNLKLFIVMGISWLLEIFASVFDNNPSWWYVSDGFNLLQGVLVFFIFVFKRSVFVAFQKKLGKLMRSLVVQLVDDTWEFNVILLDVKGSTVSHICATPICQIDFLFHRET